MLDEATETITIELTLSQAKEVATLALRSNDWDILDCIESALRDTDLQPPMDVYCELVTLRQKVRHLGGEP